MVDTNEHIRIEQELKREFEQEEERQRLFDLPGVMHINRDFPDTSDDEEESGHRYTYLYPIEDYY